MVLPKSVKFLVHDWDVVLNGLSVWLANGLLGFFPPHKEILWSVCHIMLSGWHLILMTRSPCLQNSISSAIRNEKSHQCLWVRGGSTEPRAKIHIPRSPRSLCSDTLTLCRDALTWCAQAQLCTRTSSSGSFTFHVLLGETLPSSSSLPSWFNPLLKGNTVKSSLC